MPLAIQWHAPANPKELANPWKLLLLGDGSPTLHLGLLTGEQVQVEVIGMESVGSTSDQADWPEEISQLDAPLLRRQVWLRCGNQSLAWAVSWWNQAQAEEHLLQKDQPIWRSLTTKRAELFREVDGLARVDAPWLAERFGHPGPFWSRHYRFFRGGKELTVIREVFSPALEVWLGPSSS